MSSSTGSLAGSQPMKCFAELDAIAQKDADHDGYRGFFSLYLNGVVLANSITQPIKLLAKRFGDLGEGGFGDLAQRVSLKQSNDEIAQLSKGFLTDLLKKIHESMKEVCSTSQALQVAAESVSTKHTHHSRQ